MKDFKAKLGELNTDTMDTIKYFNELDRNDVPNLLRSFKALDEILESVEVIYKAIKGLHQDLSYNIIPDVFQTHGIDSMKLAGRNFIVSSRLNASITVEKRPIAHEWLKENGLDALITPQVNSKQLSSAMSEYFQTHAKFPPEDVIKIHMQPYTQMRKVD